MILDIDSVEYKVLTYIALMMNRGKAVIDINDIVRILNVSEKDVLNALKRLSEIGAIKYSIGECEDEKTLLEKHVNYIDSIIRRRITPDIQPIWNTYRSYVLLFHQYSKLLQLIRSHRDNVSYIEQISKSMTKRLMQLLVSSGIREVSDINKGLQNYRRFLSLHLQLLKQPEITLREIISLCDLSMEKASLENVLKLLPKDEVLNLLYQLQYIIFISYPLIYPVIRKVNITSLNKTLGLGLEIDYIFMVNIEKAIELKKTKFERILNALEELYNTSIIDEKMLLPIMLMLRYDIDLLDRLVEKISLIQG